MFTALLLLTAQAQAGPCTPVLHGGVERPEGPTVSEVDWIGASPDGARVALLASRGDSRSVLAYRLSSRDTESLDVPPDPALTHEAERDRLRSQTDWLSEERLSSRALPTAIPWCQVDDSLFFADGALTWELWDEPCADGGATRQWRICTESAGRRGPQDCTEAPFLPAPLCWTEAPRLVDVYTLAGTLWFVVERPRERTTPRMAAGLRLHVP